MNKNLTKEQIIDYLRKNKQFLNISAIERAAGITYLKHVINDTPDGRGRMPTLADKHVQKLNEVLQLLNFNQKN